MRSSHRPGRATGRCAASRRGEITSAEVLHVAGRPERFRQVLDLRDAQAHGVFVNADEVAKRLKPGDPAAASLEAGRDVLRWLDALRSEGLSFVYETTLSSRQSIALMEACRSDGYRVDLVFVTLRSADLNVRRVAERVERGGHDIPEPVIRRRYDASLQRLAQAIPLADTCLVFDNSQLSPHLLLSIGQGTVVQSDVDPAEPIHARLVGIVEAALGTAVPTPPPAGSHTRR